jgi:hypothetical protein
MRCLFLSILLLAVITSSAQIDTFTVFPGDTNNDSIVTVRDLLPVGIAWFQETPPRPEPPSTDWAPQFSEGLDFLNLPVSGINYAHIDADGNGFIDTLDTDIIVLNYDSTVNSFLPPAYHPGLAAMPTPPYCPYLLLAFDRDTAMVSDTFYMDIFLEGFPPGTGVPEPEGVLGVAFTLEYDALNVRDSLLRVFPDTSSEDLMFVYATFLGAQAARSAPIRQLDFAAAGYGINAMVVDRKLATLAFITEDLILRGDGVGAPFFMDESVLKSSLLILNRQEAFFLPDCDLVMDTIILFDPVSATSGIPKEPPLWEVYPNPASSFININGNLPVRLVNMYGTDGRLVQAFSLPRQGSPLDIERLSAGVYWLQIVGEETAVWQRIVKY